MCIGNIFYVGFPKTYENISEFLKLFVSSTEAEPIGFSIDTLKGFHYSHIVRNNQTIEVELPIDFEVQNPEQRYNGIKVTSDVARNKPILVASYMGKVTVKELQVCFQHCRVTLKT